MALADEGAQIVVNYIGDRKRRAAREIQSRAPMRSFWKRMSREDHVESMFARTVREFGTVDILITNAGFSGMPPYTR